MSSLDHVLQKAREEGELVSIVKYGVRHLLRRGYTPAELGFKAKPTTSKNKNKNKNKDKNKPKDAFDMFELPDIVIPAVRDEDVSQTSLIYDTDEDED